MIQITSHLHVGGDGDYEAAAAQGWAIVSAAKEPHHRAALGYTGKGAPADHPEYRAALRGNHLILNWVDGVLAQFYRREELLLAAGFLQSHLGPYSLQATQVLIHCNQGQSRAPSLALYWLHLTDPDYIHHEPAEARFRELYPPYSPADGIREFIKSQW